MATPDASVHFKTQNHVYFITSHLGGCCVAVRVWLAIACMFGLLERRFLRRGDEAELDDTRGGGGRTRAGPTPPGREVGACGDPVGITTV